MYRLNRKHPTRLATHRAADAHEAVPRSLRRACALALCAGLAVPGAGMAARAQAQAAAPAGHTAPSGTAISEVLVTAELRPTPLLEQSGSTSVLGAEAIRLRAAQHLEEILALAPNLNFAGGSSRARYFQMRGVGERSQFIEPLNPSVGLLIDDIDFSGLGTIGTLFDVAQVEVLRGPQGTLHGANALAGLINIRSAAPEAEPGAYLQMDVADYGTRNLGLASTGPLGSEQLLYRLALHQHRSDGYQRNAFLGRDDTNARDEQTARLRLRWLAAEDSTVDLSLLHIDADNGYDAFSLDNTRSTLSDEPGQDRQRSTALGLNWTQDLGALQAALLLSAADSAVDYGFDEDWSFVGIAPDLEYSSTDRYLRDRRSYSAQLRLRSIAPLRLAGLSSDWTAGLYLLQDTETLERRYTYLASPFDSRYRARTLAAFGQLDTSLSERLTLSAGLRVAQRRFAYRDSNAVDSTPENALWGGKLALSFDLAAEQLLYASVSRGYRANGVNGSLLAGVGEEQGAVDPGAAQRLGFFDEELLINYELGHKWRSADGSLSSRLALFHMARRDQQVRASLLLPRADGSTAFFDYTDNAARGRNRGLEWELNWRPDERLQLFGSLGLLDTCFDDYVNADGEDLSGRAQAHAPEYQFALGGQFTSPGGWYLRAELEGKDAFYFSDRHDVRSRAYTLAHLRAGFRGPRWQFAAWVRNLGDEDYFVRGFGAFGNDPRKGYAVEPYYQFGEPRLVGLSAQWAF